MNNSGDTILNYSIPWLGIDTSQLPFLYMHPFISITGTGFRLFCRPANSNTAHWYNIIQGISGTPYLITEILFSTKAIGLKNCFVGIGHKLHISANVAWQHE